MSRSSPNSLTVPSTPSILHGHVGLHELECKINGLILRPGLRAFPKRSTNICRRFQAHSNDHAQHTEVLVFVVARLCSWNASHQCRTSSSSRYSTYLTSQWRASAIPPG